MFYSHRAIGQPGPITRLLACSEAQLAEYRGMDAGPTFVHHNMRFGHPTLIDEVGYPSYNKPASVMFWLDQTDVKEEFVALLDTDMQLRDVIDPRALGARRGVVVSAEYSYLVGTNLTFARRFLREWELPLLVRCGGFHIFHREDLRAIAPLWVEFTRRVRAFAHASPDEYFAESFLNWHRSEGLSAEELLVRRRQGLWQAEMYVRSHPSTEMYTSMCVLTPMCAGGGRGTSSAPPARMCPTWCAATRCSTPATPRTSASPRPYCTTDPTTASTPRTRRRPRQTRAQRTARRGRCQSRSTRCTTPSSTCTPSCTRRVARCALTLPAPGVRAPPFRAALRPVMSHRIP